MKLRELRLQMGLKQKDIARALGVSCPTVSGWEHGTANPTYDNTVKLLKLLGCTFAELAAEEEEAEK